jgi:hypothetical protein
MRESNSRGKKQRIKKRIDRLSGIVTNPETQAVTSSQSAKPESTQDKIKDLLKKREEKMKRKADQKTIKKGLGITEEEREIMKKIKGKKKEARR